MTSLRTTTLGLVLATIAAAGLTACGSETAGDADDAGSTPQLGSSSTTTDRPQTESKPELASEQLGEVVVNERLDVTAPEYPLPDIPTELAADTVGELADAYASVRGIDDVLAPLEDVTLAADERFFAYIVSACTTDEVKLVRQGDEVPMVVQGTAGLRCPPPTTLVVWVVGDEVPTDADPAPAIQK